MDLLELLIGPVPWVSGSHSSGQPEQSARQVVCSTFSLFRNLSFYPFLPSIQEEQGKEILEKLTGCFMPHKDGLLCSLKKLELNELRMLWERCIFPPVIFGNLNFSESPGGPFTSSQYEHSAAILSHHGGKSILINMKEHLVYSYILPGVLEHFTEESRKKLLKEMHDDLSKETWAHEPSLGYLNSDPAVTGTGFRVSSLIHFPGISLSRNHEQLLNALNAIGLRGYGFNVLAGKGNFFWVSSRSTLGCSEEEIIADFSGKIQKLLKIEEESEQEIYKADKNRIEDKIFRAYYQLLSARLMSYSEFLELSSIVRLGVYLQLIQPEILELLNVLQIKSATGHIQLGEENPLCQEEMEVLRATMVRLTLSEIMNIKEKGA
ncbi:MAG: hypothetical protein HQK83_18210 [Fibrobacteria bacterium]|nr:hypothetical protein [Fibrobacteria bacterium]